MKFLNDANVCNVLFSFVDPDEEESSDEDSEQDEMDAFNMMIKNEPGSNSGCTAVVALLRGMFNNIKH